MDEGGADTLGDGGGRLCVLGGDGERKMAKLEFKLTRDTLFKILFVKHQDLLKNLVSQVLGIEMNTITKFEIKNPRITAKNLGDKNCVLDIVMEVNDQKVNLEVQVDDEGDYPVRSLFYWAGSYSSALLEGGEYIDLPRTVAINIIDFKLFKDTKDFYSEFRALEVTRHTELTDKMSLKYFELPKLPEVTEADAGNGLKLWLALFNAKTDEELSKIEKIEGEIMEQAVKAYKNVVASKRFKNAERLRERARNDAASAMGFAERKGKAEGITQGIAQAKAEIVLNMHEAGFSVTDIAKATKIPETEVKLILKSKPETDNSNS